MRRSRSAATGRPLLATATVLTVIGLVSVVADPAAEAVTVSGRATADRTTAEDMNARQRQYAAAAKQYGVPLRLLLSVSYLESRWDSHRGSPSMVGGFGPMHLTDQAHVKEQRSEADLDGRGDETRPSPATVAAEAPDDTVPEPGGQTLELAADLIGADQAAVRTDPATNIRAGAALLSRYQQETRGPVGDSTDPAQWSAAVARYSGATDQSAAGNFVSEVYRTMSAGLTRITDDGQKVHLDGRPVTPQPKQLTQPAAPVAADTDCPDTVGCEWIAAPRRQKDPNGSLSSYGSWDPSDRPARQKIRYIVIHDTEGTYASALQELQASFSASWNYTIRASDGQIAQHVRTKDVAWHASNWGVNATSIGVEHEGFAAQGTWFTEVQYQSSARLVRYLAQRYDIPLDPQHIVGHNDIPGAYTASIPSQHWDPGPYWDWTHYFDLLGAPLAGNGAPESGLLTIKPDPATNQPAFLACDTTNRPAPCAARGSSTVVLHSAPDAASPLVADIGITPAGTASSMDIDDWGAQAYTGQQYALAGVEGDWTAIWYNGQKAWFPNPASAPTAVRSEGLVVTPKAGLSAVPVYGRAYPEPAAFPPGTNAQTLRTNPYTLKPGEFYSTPGEVIPSEYYQYVNIDGSKTGDATVIRGSTKYLQIQYGSRFEYVNADDVQVLPATAVEH